MAIVEFKDVTRVYTSGTITVNGRDISTRTGTNLQTTGRLPSALCSSSIT